MKLIEMIAARNTIESLYEREDIEFSVTYKMSKYLASTQSDFEYFANETNKLIKEFGEKDSSGEYIIDGSNVKIASEYLDTFSKRYAELQEIEVTEPDIRFKFSELEGLKISIKQITPLLPLIDEDK